MRILLIGRDRIWRSVASRRRRPRHPRRRWRPSWKRELRKPLRCLRKRKADMLFMRHEAQSTLCQSGFYHSSWSAIFQLRSQIQDLARAKSDGTSLSGSFSSFFLCMQRCVQVGCRWEEMCEGDRVKCVCGFFYYYIFFFVKFSCFFCIPPGPSSSPSEHVSLFWLGALQRRIEVWNVWKSQVESVGTKSREAK